MAAHESLFQFVRRWWAKGWKLNLLVGVRGLSLYTDYPHRFYLVVGPWAISFGPWSRTSRYANGSRWQSGWHRPKDEELTF